ncbi:hypothetical protein [Phenylobacterium sp.]|uniref:hypothetical protein n=1 Tax=Phenylobacterium sp. TaxID=1871053 RepID=UPI0027339184|nr:hypothetical protein [Phenylobacterium sp.]MDP3855625.1 hypothetical protein [Phenylobacterium sp.]
MGAVAWVAFNGRSRAEAIEALGYVDTGAEAEVDDGLVCAELPGGWVTVVAIGKQAGDFSRAEFLAPLSREGPVLAVDYSTTVMWSIIQAYAGGGLAWSVEHDPEEGIDHLAVVGEPPPQYIPLRDRLLAEQEAEGGEDAGVDLIFDLPALLSEALCGYQPEQADDQPAFTALRRPARVGAPASARKRRGLLGFLFR